MDILKELLIIIKKYTKDYGGFIVAAIVWAFIFRQLSNIKDDSLYLGGTDYWGWLFFTWWAIATGMFIGMNKNKKDK